MGTGDDWVTLNAVQTQGARLSFGSGQDTLEFGTFLDSFQNGVITVTDFATGDGGDRLEWTEYLADTLDGWNGSDNPFAAGYLQLVQSGTSTLLQIDRDGGGNNFTTLATFLNTNASSFTTSNLDGFANLGPQYGTIARDVFLGAGEADVFFGIDGNDRLSGGDQSDQLDGGLGDDALFGGLGSDHLNGSDGNDYIRGEEGDDVLLGGLGNDRLTGSAGVDALRGGAGNDVYYLEDAAADGGDTIIEAASEGIDTVWAGFDYTLSAELDNLQVRYGNWRGTGNGLDNLIRANGGDNLLEGLGGNDTLYGGTGRDTLTGGDGADRLFGGVGRDLLTGGAGEDRFLFARAEDLSSRAGESDIITDFELIEGDRINLADLDAIAGTPANEAFAFIGSGAFTGTAGELRYGFDAGRTVVEMDTNGDAVADVFLRLEGQIDLTASAFIL